MIFNDFQCISLHKSACPGLRHKVFTGDRPSNSLLLPCCDPYHLGLLLSLYEHRTAVQGWVWNVNSFDQWGVELGKVLGVKVRKYLSEARKGLKERETICYFPPGGGDLSSFQRPTQRLERWSVGLFLMRKLMSAMLSPATASGDRIVMVKAREIFDSRGNPTVEARFGLGSHGFSLRTASLTSFSHM